MNTIGININFYCSFYILVVHQLAKIKTFYRITYRKVKYFHYNVSYLFLNSYKWVLDAVNFKPLNGGIS